MKKIRENRNKRIRTPEYYAQIHVFGKLHSVAGLLEEERVGNSPSP